MLGHIYCSLQTTPMTDMTTGTLFIRSKQLEETSEHISRLSVRCTLSGEQRYKVGGNDHLVRPDNYLLVNQGQNYKTSFRSSSEQEMILVAFQPGFGESLLYSLITPADVLLENPFHTTPQKVSFFEKTYDQDPVIANIFTYLRGLMEVDYETRKDTDLDGLYTALLVRVLEIQRGLAKEIDKISSVKQSTRVELFRRLGIARDYMEANLHQKITLEDLATAACLSVHHFKREFKLLYGVTPHRHLFLRRVEKARALLSRNILKIDEVATASGFENTSSFIRQFRRFTGHTPGELRKASSNRT